MKKRGANGQTGNPARKRRGPPAPPPAKPWSRWLGREMQALFSLPNYLGELILFAVLAIVVALWRWLAS